MQTTLGQRAAIQLDLQEIRRSLSAAMAARASATDMAVENGALADEYRAEGKHQLALSYAATSIAWRSRAAVLSAEVSGLMTQEQALVAKLKAAEPVVLTRDESEGMDDMAGLCGVAA